MKNDKAKSVVAYFSMEIAVATEIKTYAGGLGVLAGDILCSAAESKFSMVGLTLLNREGYFKQTITAQGQQLSGSDISYDFSHLKKLSQEVVVQIGREQVKVGVWQYIIRSANRSTAPVYFLDTDIVGNSQANRKLTGRLYGGNEEYRLKQEIILGRAGVTMLKSLGYTNVKKYHLNEGHGALAAVELFLNSPLNTVEEKVKAVRKLCVFTTHTPLEKGQDIFSLPYLLEYQSDFPQHIKEIINKNEVNLTRVGLYFSGYINAVSKFHRLVTQKMFSGYKIQAITNGVNSLNWTSLEFKRLYDKYIPGWRIDNSLLRGADKIPSLEVWSSHQKEKERLINYINKTTKSDNFKKEIFTIGFIRRFAPYKRPELLFKDINKLLEVQSKSGKIQIIYAGKAHPRDLEGQALIKKIWQLKNSLTNKISIVFVEDYDLAKARLLSAGVDLWLNTPLPPNEASGTSGMKAAHNGIVQLSTGDGWWLEGYKKDKTGWLIKENLQTGENNLYELLEKEILPTYYINFKKWRKMMSMAVSINASYFNTQRVLRQYMTRAYK